MPLLLRKIRKARWHPPEGEAWLPTGDVPADSLGDLATDGNRLSVWAVDDSQANLDRVLCALAGNCNYISNIDYVLVDQQAVAALDLKIESVAGGTPDSEANTQWHRDIVELSVARLGALAKALSTCPRTRLPKKKVGTLLAKAVGDGWVDQSRLGEKLAAKLVTSKE